jgi:hypothetical protein
MWAEEWETIPEYPFYEVSNYGRVWTVRRGHILKPCSDKNGYQIVILFHLGKRTDVKVHRLVASEFVRSSFGQCEVNHCDGNKRNNYFENLEWTTHQENMSHAFRNGLSKRTSIRIIETNEIFESITACAIDINGNGSAISDCLRGKRKRHRGFTFEYVD